MDAGMFRRPLWILLSAILLTASWTTPGPAGTAEEDAGIATIALIQGVQPNASASPNLGTLNLDGLVAYSSILKPENNPKTQGDAYLRRIAGTHRSPEPTILIVMGLGLIGLAGIGKKIKKR